MVPYIIVAILVTMLLTSIVTALMVKFCCSGSGNGEVSPRA